MQATTANEFKRAARRTHVLASGRTIEYRYVSVDQITARGVLPPGLLAGARDDEDATERATRAHVAEDPGAITRLIDVVLACGITRPRIWEGPPDACPEDAILVGDLAEDRLEAFGVLIAHSNMSATITRGAAFRRSEPGAGGSDRPDGDATRDDGAAGLADGSGDVGVRTTRAGHRRRGAADANAGERAPR